LDVAQPALSHHLKVLQQAGLLTRRREGTSLFYRRVLQHSQHAKLVDSLFASMDGLAETPSQLTQVEAIHAERRMRSEAFFSANAELLIEQRTRISDPETYSEAAAELLALVADDSTPRPRRALEVGPGEGQLLTLLADRYEAVLGIDSSAQMLERAKAAIGNKPNIKLRLQDFAALPARRNYNAVAAAMVLHHQASPPAFFRQAFQLLKPGGVFILVDLCRHNQEWVRDICGDFWLGFEPDELLEWAAAAKFTPPASQYLTQNNGFQIQLHAFTKE
jgi:ArsR family transcriptional regulator